MQANIKSFFTGKRSADPESPSHRTNVDGRCCTIEDAFLDSGSSSDSSSDEDKTSLAYARITDVRRPHALPTAFAKPPGPGDLGQGRTEGPVQPKQVSYPTTQFGVKRRSFRSAWYDAYSWLEYSVSRDAAFCFCCRLFPVPSKPHSENIFTSVGYRQWKKATEKDAGFAQHDRSDYHKQTFCAWKDFQDHLIKETTIGKVLTSAHEKSITENKHYVKQIARVLCLTARQKIAQRGHREGIESENRGNFLEILELISENDEIVCNKLRGNQRVKYTSPQIQNEILGILANMIQTEISQEVNDSVDYSIMVDESKDISKKEQMSVVVRYIYNNSIHEEFLDFTHLKELNAAYLKDRICDVLSECGIRIQDCVAQTYDGASVMSGCNKGVQSLFREDAPQAVYIHCYNHRLNLVIVDSVKSVKMAENFFSFLQELYVFMSSHVPYELFLKKQAELFPDRQPRTLKKLSDTRWACQYAACKVILDTLPSILDTLAEISEHHTGKRAHDARCLLTNFTFTTVVCLEMFTHILLQTKLLSDMLQSPSLDLSAAADHIDTVKSDVKGQRCEKVWHSIWEKAGELSKTLDIEIEPPPKRVGRLPRRFSSDVVMAPTGQREEAGTTENEYRSKLYYPVMDSLLSEMEKRFTSANNQLLRSISALDPRSPSFLDKSHLLTMAQQYGIEEEYMEVELRQAKRLVDTQVSKGMSIASMGAFGAFMRSYKDAFPDLCRLINIALVLPPTSASCERSFSSMRHIKSYLRSTMSDTKLSALGIIGIHPQRAKELNMEEFVRIFSDKHNNRLLQLF